MDAVKSILIPLLLLTSSLAAASESIPTHEQTRVINYAKHNLTISIARLGDRIKKCETEQDSAQTPNIDPTSPELKNIEKEKLSRAILYLSRKNMESCEGNARLAASYDAQALAAVLKRYGVKKGEGIDQANKALLTPDVEAIANGSVFFHLPEETKKYLTNAVGNSPFDPIRTAQKNRLFPSHSKR